MSAITESDQLVHVLSEEVAVDLKVGGSDKGQMTLKG